MTLNTSHLMAWSVAKAACAAALFTVALSMSCIAQDHRAKPEEPGLFESIARWLERQSDNINSSIRDTGKGVENFGREAGVAAQTTLDGAKDAAGAVVRIPAARVVSGHEKCRNAPNGAPDCVAAAIRMCQARGFESGKSADMTTAEVCPAQTYLQGRNSGPECRIETFVSRSLCQ